MSDYDIPKYSYTKNGETLVKDEKGFANLILEIYRRRKRLVISSFVFISTLITFQTLIYRKFFPIYDSGFTLLVSDPISESSSSGKGLTDEVFEELALGNTSNDLPTLIDLLKSSFFLEPISEKYNIKEKKLRKMIDIKPGGDPTSFRDRADGILVLSFESRKPKKDILLLQDLSQAYLRTTKSMRQETLSEGLAFLNSQEPILQEKVSSIQQKLESLRLKNSLIKPEITAKEIGEELKRLTYVAEGLETEKNRLLEVKTKIKNGLITAIGFDGNINSAVENGNFMSSSSSGLSLSSKDQSLLNELLKVNKELSIAKSKYTENSKYLKSLQTRRDQLRPILINNQIETVNAALSINKTKMQTVLIQKEKLKEKFDKTPVLLKDYQVLIQKLELAQKNLTGLFSAREKLLLEIAQSTVPWKIINPPKISEKPVEPNLIRNIAGGLFLGILGGFLIGYLREKTDNVLHNVEELKGLISSPILAEIPYIEDPDNLISTENGKLKNMDSKKLKTDDNSYNRFFYEEAFRYLYTSLRFLNSSKKIKNIAITSAIPGEGKTTICVLLCRTLLSMGQKVLLIDADLRKPRVHKALEIDNILGLSNILTGDITDWEKTVNHLADDNQFDVITSGVRPPDAPRLLGSERFKDFIDILNAKNIYDLIIIDNTPVGGLSDPLLVSEKMDGLIVTVSLNNVSKPVVNETFKRIDTNSNKVNLLGVVANQRKYIKKFDKKYGYGYGYQYNYLYEQYAQDPREKQKDNLEDIILLPNFLKENQYFQKFYKKLKLFLNWVDN